MNRFTVTGLQMVDDDDILSGINQLIDSMGADITSSTYD